MYKTKVFLGTVGNPADNKFNNWSETHPYVTILEFRYMQARMGDHSICILYKEKNDAQN